MTTKTPRAKKQDRAGTPINTRECITVYGFVNGRNKVHGHIDPRQRLYQAGGELGRFVYWKVRGISFGMEVWTTILNSHVVDTIEMIDHDRNECYRIPLSVAIQIAIPYRDRIGLRMAVPLSFWERLDAHGVVLSSPPIAELT